MFQPCRYRHHAIYDIKMLLPSPSVLHERVYVEAFKRLPAAFLVGVPWGEEKSQSCLWIDLALHDATYFEIRNRLQADADYLVAVTAQMVREVEALAHAVGEAFQADLEAWHPDSLIASCFRAVTWFATNWLNAHESIRMALFRFSPEAYWERDFELLLQGDHLPIFIQSYVRLEAVRQGAMSPAEYLRYWGPSYAMGDEVGPLQEDADVLRLIEDDRAFSRNKEVLLRKNQTLRQRRARLVERVIGRAREHDGEAGARLLAAQIAYLTRVIWQEEMRHLYQQQAYAVIRQWIRHHHPEWIADRAAMRAGLAPMFSTPQEDVPA